MIEPRIYRAAFLPALLALVLVAFSLESPPRGLDQGLAADALFEGDSAVKTVQSIVDAAPDRHAGSAGDRATARRVADVFRASGFTTKSDRFDDDDRNLVNVVGRRAGTSSREVVVLAARDSAGKPDAPGSAADTAALMQFAQVFEGRALRRTLVLASVDGGEVGDAGARRFVDQLAEPGDVEAVIVLSDLGARRSRGPLVTGWSNSVTRAGIGLEKTVTGSLREELGRVPRQEGTVAQFVRLAYPIAPGGQAAPLEAGIDAVRVGGAGEVSRDTGGGVGEVNADRYGALGRSVLRMIATLDGSGRQPKRGSESFVRLGGMVLPLWALKLLALALALPALVASIDALARARRRREPVGPWFGWLAGNALPFVVALVLVWLMALVGLITDAPPAPLDPARVTLDGAAVAALCVTALAAVATWVLMRTRLVRASAPPDATSPGAGSALSLALAALVFVMALFNPYAALLLVPAAHLWMLATLTGVRRSTTVVLAVVGAVPPLFVFVYYCWRLGLSPARGGWYLLLLVTGNQPGLLTTLAGVGLLALLASVAAIAVARVRRGDDGERERGSRRGRAEEPRPSIFGPGGHAGPGAIGSVGSSGTRR